MGAPRLVGTGPVAGPQAGAGGLQEVRSGRVFGGAGETGPSGGGVAVRGSGARDRGVLRSWPLVLLAVPAAVAVWSGWVGIGELTGFGQVHPLPGIWSSLHIDSAVTLPVGVEAYAAYALHAWLAGGARLGRRTRRFAKWSAIGSLLLGMAGQVAYHLLTQAGATRAPWGVTTAVACLPVLMLGMAAALAHMIRADSSAAQASGGSGGALTADAVAGLGGEIGARRLAEARAGR